MRILEKSYKSYEKASPRIDPRTSAVPRPSPEEHLGSVRRDCAWLASWQARPPEGRASGARALGNYEGSPIIDFLALRIS